MQLSLAGLIGTAASGTVLAVWGAPLRPPGLFRWGELGDRLLGSTYQWAFRRQARSLPRRGSRRRRSGLVPATASAWVALGGFIAAVIAVTVMTQAHLFTHL